MKIWALPFAVCIVHDIKEHLKTEKKSFSKSDSMKMMLFLKRVHCVKYRIFTYFSSLEILWKSTASAELRANRAKFCLNFLFSQDFHIRKLVEIRAFYAVVVANCPGSKFAKVNVQVNWIFTIEMSLATSNKWFLQSAILEKNNMQYSPWADTFFWYPLGDKI